MVKSDICWKYSVYVNINHFYLVNSGKFITCISVTLTLKSDTASNTSLWRDDVLEMCLESH